MIKTLQDLLMEPLLKQARKHGPREVGDTPEGNAQDIVRGWDNETLLSHISDALERRLEAGDQRQFAAAQAELSKTIPAGAAIDGKGGTFVDVTEQYRRAEEWECAMRRLDDLGAPSGEDAQPLSIVGRIEAMIAATQAEARGWEGQSHSWQDRAENAECRVSRLEGKLARELRDEQGEADELRKLLHTFATNVNSMGTQGAARQLVLDMKAFAVPTKSAEQSETQEFARPIMTMRTCWRLRDQVIAIRFRGEVLADADVGGVFYRIDSHDEHGLPVIERTAEMPKWAKYANNCHRQYAREYQSWMHPESSWQRIEDYNALAEPAQREGS